MEQSPDPGCFNPLATSGLTGHFAHDPTEEDLSYRPPRTTRRQSTCGPSAGASGSQLHRPTWPVAMSVTQAFSESLRLFILSAGVRLVAPRELIEDRRRSGGLVTNQTGKSAVLISHGPLGRTPFAEASTDHARLLKTSTRKPSSNSELARRSITSLTGLEGQVPSSSPGALVRTRPMMS